MRPEIEAKLPKLCYSVIPGNEPGKRIGVIKRGESGYYLTDFDRPDTDSKFVESFVDMMNGRLGVTKAQAEAMMIGSMCGWDVPGADPDRYKERLAS